MRAKQAASLSRYANAHSVENSAMLVAMPKRFYEYQRLHVYD